MIKFFRKIRQRLLAKNRLGKYLLYAIGEIVLVVIGILIALYLNNNNEQSKKEAKVELIFTDIMEELTSDIEKTTNLMRYYTRRDSMIYLVLNDRITAKDYENDEIPSALTWHLTGWYDIVELTNDSYNNLTEDLDAIPPKYNDVLKDLSHLYNRLKTVVDTHNQGMLELVEKNSEIQMRNYSWFAGRSESDRKNEMAYLLNDFRYKNEVEGYRNKGIKNQLRWSINYRQKAIECYQKIAKLLHKPLDHKSFLLDQEIAKLLVGEWHIVGQPGEGVTHFLKDKRLYGKYKNHQYEIFYLSGNKLVDSDTDYATIVQENGETILKYNRYNLKKVD